MSFASTKGYRDWLARMAAVPTLVDQAIALMTEGVRTGNVPPKVLMERVPAQIAAQIVEEPAQSPFYRPFTKFPDAVPKADRKALRSEEHTSELQSLMRISYAVFCSRQKTNKNTTQ